MQLYDQLLQFPLFQGMSRDDLEHVTGHTRFDFIKYAAGKRVAVKDTPCNMLLFLLNGTILVESFADDESYSVSELLEAPYTLEPEAVFSYRQRYSHTFTAHTDVSMFAITKAEVLRLTENFFIFRLNLVNIFSTLAQKQQQTLWISPPMTLRDRLVKFLTQRTISPSGPKTFRILMNRLADELNDTRLNISHVLNQLQNEGLLTLHRGRIEIPMLEKLIT